MPTARPVLAAFLAAAVAIGANTAYTSWAIHNAQQQSAEVSARAGREARAQGAIVERRLCLTLGRLAALKPPQGNPAANPSRAFDQDQHAVLAQLGPDIRCPRGSR